MGRELKRVPLDFKWSTKQIWKGYINPYQSMDCKSCDGTHLNSATKKLSDDWYTHLRTDGKKGWSEELTDIEVKALAEGGRLDGLIPNRPFLDDETGKWMAHIDNQLTEVDKPEFPSAEEVNDYFKNKRIFGHDSINHWVCTKARAKHLGIYGNCEFCDEDGQIWHTDEIKKLADEWEGYEPPIGEGYQLWTTTNEGAPMSPVFKTLAELCEWCANNATTFADFTATKEEWMKMLDDGLVTAKSGNAIFI